MAHYIDKDALVAEIDRRHKYNHARTEIDRSACKAGRTAEDKEILDFLNTLEVKEVDLNKEKMIKDVEQLKAQAEKRYDEIGKSGYIQPNLPLAKGTDNIVTIEYANNHNKEHVANLGYYNGVIMTCEKILGFLRESANEGNNNH